MALARYEHTGGAPAVGLAAPIGSADASFTVTPSGNGYPTGAVGDFVVCIDAGTTSEEKILCSARSGTVFTVATSGRGYDGTSAASHNAGSTNVSHVYSAAEADDTSAHIYTTTRDDHTQYLRVDGTRAGTGAQTIGGALTVSSGGAQVTGNSKVTGTLETTAGLTVDAGGVTVTAGGATVTGNSKVTGTLEVTAATTIDAGGLTVTAGGVTVAAGTAALQAVTGTTMTASSTVQGTALVPTGLTGATSASRYVGATASGAPGSGTFAVGDFVIDQTGKAWVCTAAGTPGTWVAVGSVRPTCRVHRAAAYTLTTGVATTMPFDTSDVDNKSGFSAATGLYTVPEAGDYLVFTTYKVNTTATTAYFNCAILKNGVDTGSDTTNGGNGAATGSAFAMDVVNCAANDTLGVTYGTNTAAGLVNAVMSITKVSV